MLIFRHRRVIFMDKKNFAGQEDGELVPID